MVQASSPAVPKTPAGAGPLPAATASTTVWRAPGGYQLSNSEIYKAAVLAEVQRQQAAQALQEYAAALAEQQAQQASQQSAAEVAHSGTDPSVYGINGSYIIPNARITFYSCTGEGFCGNMANGEPAYEGAVACSSNLPLGTTLRILSDPSGRVLVCLDRGILSPTWIDVYFYNAADGWAWQSVVGSMSDIEILN